MYGRSPGIRVALDNKTGARKPVAVKRLGKLVEILLRLRREVCRIQVEIDEHVEAGGLGSRLVAFLLSADADASRCAQFFRFDEIVDDLVGLDFWIGEGWLNADRANPYDSDR